MPRNTMSTKRISAVGVYDAAALGTGVMFLFCIFYSSQITRLKTSLHDGYCIPASSVSSLSFCSIMDGYVKYSCEQRADSF